MPRSRWQTELEQLRRDNRSGASEIERRASELLQDTIGEAVPGDSVQSYRRWLAQLGRDLVAAQPAMAGLFRLVNDLLWACASAPSAEATRQCALTFLQEHRARSAAALEAAAQNAAALLAPYHTLMTYSRSATVLRALTLWARGRRQARVLCSEARPMLEGQTLASELGWAGIEVTLGVDMALFGWLSEAQALVLGADSLSVAGVVNKIGSAELVRAAAAANLPRFVVCTTGKFLPSDYLLDPCLRAGDPEEIMPVSNKNITVRNIYFDLTPLDLISAVITEEGALEPAPLRERLAPLQVYPGLRGKRVV